MKCGQASIPTEMHRSLKTTMVALCQEVCEAYEEDDRNYLARKITELGLADRQNAPKAVWEIIGEIQPSFQGPSSKPQLKARPNGRMEDVLCETPQHTSNGNRSCNKNWWLHSYRRSSGNPKPQGLKSSRYSLCYVSWSHEVWWRKTAWQASTLLNLVKKNLVIPNEWKTFICAPLAKKGDPTNTSNYPRITLMSITSKVYNGLSLNRIRDPLEKILHVNQAGFCCDCGCVEQIDLLLRILECVLEIGSCLEVSFIILTKGSTFQSVSFKCASTWGWILGPNIRPLLSTWFLPNIFH